MSTPCQEPPRLPLLQRVCHAGLISLVTLMADHADDLNLDQVDKLAHLDLNKITRVSIQLPKMRYDDQLDVRKTEVGRINGDATETKNPHLGSPKMSALITVGDDPLDDHDDFFIESDTSELSALVLPNAPIYSFDEDGEILQRVNIITPNLSGNGSPLSDTPYDDPIAYKNDINDPVPLPITSTPETDLPVGVDDLWHRVDQSLDDREDYGVSTTLPSCHPLISSLGVLESLPNIDDSPADNTLVHQVSSLRVDDASPEVKAGTEDTSVAGEAKTAATTNDIPMIDFHAASIEVVDDYLEDNLEENQLGDLCSTILGDTGSWQNSGSTSSPNCVAGLLSAVPQDTPCKRQRVPFHTVVFTERKPSTGDALVLSLGLSADGANTIQDIASKNQGAARERLQQGEMLPAETKFTRHCESCGVSPEDCLKKLGLHSDHVGLMSPSPKSERLLQFFRNIHPLQPRPHRCHSPTGSDPQLDQSQQTAPRPQSSRSLTSSPTHSEDGGRKPRLNTF